MSDALRNTTNVHVTRESWLQAAVEHFRPWFEQAGKPLPNIQISFGVGTKKHIGVCYHAICAKDKATRNVFVCSRIGEPLRVLDIVLHELCHAALPDEEKHGKEFRKLALKTMGLSGKAAATICEPGTELHEKLTALAEVLGPLPHLEMDPFVKVKKPPQGGWLKYVSRSNPKEYYLRIPPKRVEEHGAPMDPWGEEMVPADALGEDDE